MKADAGCIGVCQFIATRLLRYYNDNYKENHNNDYISVRPHQ